MKIGWGRREFSLDVPVSMNGQVYLRVCQGILDPLYMTALVIEGEETVVFVSMDITGPNNDVHTGIIEKVRAKYPEIPVDAFIFNATHTHSSMQLWVGAEKTPDGVEFYSSLKARDHAVSMGAEAVIEAYENRKEGGMAYGYGYAVVGHSRRVLYSVDMGQANPASAAPNGHAIMYGRTNRPEFAGYEAGADHFVNLMYTFDGHDQLTGIVINVPCPSQTSEHFRKLSADYWADVRENVAREFGENVYVLPQCAPAGDISPRILHYKQAEQRRMGLKYGLHYDCTLPPLADLDNFTAKALAERKDIAERILAAVKEVYAWASKDIQRNPVVRHIRKELPVTKRYVSDEEAEWCRENIRYLEENLPDPASCSPEEYRVKRSSFDSFSKRNLLAIERNKEEKPGEKAIAVVHAVRIGEIAFATNRFELYIDYMHQIQARSPFIQTFLIQLAGEGVAGYLPTERAKQNKGYSASIFCNKVGPEGGHDLVEGTLELLNHLSEL